MAIERTFGRGQNALRARTLIAGAIVGQMLPDGAVKGGSAIRLRFGGKDTRFTSDLDTAIADDIGKFAMQLNESLNKGWHGFTGHAMELPQAHPKTSLKNMLCTRIT